MATLEQIIERNDLKPRAANCGSHSILGRLENDYVVFPTRCGSWQCPRCCQVNTYQWALKVMRQPATRFITLTKLGETREEVTASVREFHRRLRAVGYVFEYWGMVELHASGLPHWHALCFGDYLPPIAMKWIARESGIGHTDIRKLTSRKGCVYYCAKHLGHAHGRRWHGRQVRYSRNFFQVKEEVDPNRVDYSDFHFELVFGRANFVKEKMGEFGFKIEGGDGTEDFIVGDTMVQGEIQKTGKRDMLRGYGIFHSKHMGVTCYEQ